MRARWLLLLSLPACASRWHSLDGVRIAQPPQNVPAVVLFDDSVLTFSTSGGKPVLDRKRHVANEIASVEGEGLATIAIPYNRTFTRIVALHARAISPLGEEKNLTLADARDAPREDAGMLYSDSRVVILQTPYRARGSIVEYELETQETETPVSFESVALESKAVIARMSFSIHAPLGWKIDYSVDKNGEALDAQPRVRRSIGSERWEWQRSNVPAMTMEDAQPSFEVAAAHLSVRLSEWTSGGVTHHANAETLSAWAASLQSTESNADARTVAIAQCDGAASDDERAQRLFAWVRDTIGYCAIEIGEGGWRPHAPSAVLGGRYGDCKDKAHLLQTLLGAVGIPSEMTIINAALSWQPSRPTSVLPHFNHAILLIHLASGDRFADPTDRAAPFGELPLVDQHAPYLVERAHGGKILTTPEASPADNQRELMLTLSPHDGDLVGQARWTLNGAQAAQVRSWLGTSDHVHDEKQVEHHLLSGLRAREVSADRKIIPATPTPLLLSANVRAPHAWSSAQKVHLIRLTDFLPANFPSLRAGPRLAPVVLPMRELVNERVTVLLPPNARTTLPSPQHAQGPAGAIDVNFISEKGTVTMERKVRIDTRVVMAEDYPALVELIAAAARAEAQPVIVEE